MVAFFNLATSIINDSYALLRPSPLYQLLEELSSHECLLSPECHPRYNSIIYIRVNALGSLKIHLMNLILKLMEQMLQL
jgi:hypothetical protein